MDKPSEEVKQPKSGVLDEKEEDVHGEKKSESDSDKPLVDNGDVTRKEVQEESVRAEENAPSAPDPGAEGERSRDDTVNEAQEQEKTTSAGDK